MFWLLELLKLKAKLRFKKTEIKSLKWLEKKIYQ